ncbi:hypothetical protein C8J57DRAFT_1529458 [Mycena rebaudengoi]|nr:hypothetical protein C8J57DRAFT_1529458 [Mycena rebaudengoi]
MRAPSSRSSGTSHSTSSQLFLHLFTHTPPSQIYSNRTSPHDAASLRVFRAHAVRQTFFTSACSIHLDPLCRDIVYREIQSLKRAPRANAWLGPLGHMGLAYHREAEAEMRAADQTFTFALARIHIIPIPADPAGESVVSSGVDGVDSRMHVADLSPFGRSTELVHRTAAMAIVSSIFASFNVLVAVDKVAFIF